MSSSVLAIGDLHFKNDNTEQTYKACEQILNIVKARINDLNAVVILGDILHRHDQIDFFPFKRAINFLMKLRKILDFYELKDKMPRYLWIIIGNHDRPNNSVFCTDEHVFNSLKLWNNTVVADKREIVEAGDQLFILVPYVFPGRFEEALGGKTWEKDIEDETEIKISAVFAHQEFFGVKYGGVISEKGDIYSKKSPPCISGHIHEPSILQKNIFYVGTPYNQTWINVQNLKYEKTKYGLNIFNFNKKRSLESVERINLDKVPLKLLLNYSSPKEFNNDIDNTHIKNIKKHLLEKKMSENIMDCQLKIKIKCNSKDEFEELSKYRIEKNILIKEGIKISIDWNKENNLFFSTDISEKEEEEDTRKPFLFSTLLHNKIKELKTKNNQTAEFIEDVFSEAFL